MADSQSHITQANSNLRFLESICAHHQLAYFDWKVTVSFYAALHIINAHLAKFSVSYRSHKEVKDAINPYNQLSPSKIPKDIYLAYVSLQALSRRSRYLVKEKDPGSELVALTYEKHFAKALRHLNAIVRFYNREYGVQFYKPKVKCSGVKAEELDMLTLE